MKCWPVSIPYIEVSYSSSSPSSFFNDVYLDLLSLSRVKYLLVYAFVPVRIWQWFPVITFCTFCRSVQKMYFQSNTIYSILRPSFWQWKICISLLHFAKLVSKTGMLKSVKFSIFNDKNLSILDATQVPDNKLMSHSILCTPHTLVLLKGTCQKNWIWWKLAFFSYLKKKKTYLKKKKISISKY